MGKSFILKNWVLASRPKTLTASWIPVITASCLAQALRIPVQPWIIFSALFGSTFIQIATNLFNDAYDFKKGADTQSRLGPQRMSASGTLEVETVFKVAILCGFVAFLFGIPLVYRGGVPIILVGVTSLFFSYGYTAGPFPLSYLGLGDLFVFIFFGIIAVLGTFFLHSLSFSFPIEAWFLSFQIGAWAVVLIAINNLRDIEEDSVSKKWTLAARFGKTFARFEITSFELSPFILGVLFWQKKLFVYAAYLPLLISPLAFFIVYSVWRSEPSVKYNRLLAGAGAVQLLSGLALSLGFYLK